MAPEITITSDAVVYCQRIEQRPRQCPYFTKLGLLGMCEDCNLLLLFELVHGPI